MNIFILSEDPVEAAQLQCDKHVVKMIVESAQMLCANHRLLDGDNVRQPNILYRICHANHPCTVWARKTTSNYWWLYQHFIALCDEYTHRYGKVHKTDELLRDVLANYPTNIPANFRTEFAMAMGTNPECIHPNDPVRSYREFYQTKQDRFKMVWTKREVPSWFTVK
jgi:hypothetical protein